MKKIYWASLIALIIILPIIWYLLSPLFIIIELNEISPMDSLVSTARNIMEGNFIPGAHEVSGKAVVIENENKKILRFENFETINGPDLFIYLSSDLDNKEFIDLGKIKATKGNVNYQLPENVDLEKYNKVLVWCRAFRILFSYAELK